MPVYVRKGRTVHSQRGTRATQKVARRAGVLSGRAAPAENGGHFPEVPIPPFWGTGEEGKIFFRDCNYTGL